MAEEKFDFEAVLAKLAACVENKAYYVMKGPLKELAAHPENDEVRTTLLDTLDFLKDHQNPQSMLYLLHEMINDLEKKKSIEASYLQAKLVDKWEESAKEGIQSDWDSTLSYLTSAASGVSPGHPLEGKALGYWETAVDAHWPLQSFDLECNLAIDREATNADYRHAALSRLAKAKDTDPDTVLRMLNNAIDRGGFYSFREKDAESVSLIGKTLADILEVKQAALDDKTIQDLAWKVFVRCEGCDAAAEKKAAQIYLKQADRAKDMQAVFNICDNLVNQRNAHIADVSRDAALKILDLVDSGALKPDGSGIDEIGRCVYERIFEKSRKEETKDDALAARAADTLLGMVRGELSKPDTHSAYLYFNSAQALYSYFPAGDPREAEVVQLWQDALQSHKARGSDDYYARQMGWMLDSATAKGDVALAAKAKTEWRDTIDNMAQGVLGARDAHHTVQQIVVNAANYKPDSALVAEARAMLPDLEKRAGIKKAPEKVGNDDFLKMIGKKRQPGFKP